MQYQPKSEADLMKEMLLPDGIYDFEVIDAKDTHSKAGNEMIALVLRVFKQDGSTVQMRDWLVNQDHPMCQMKIRHFCKSVGVDYESGYLGADHIVGVAGKCEVVSENSGDFGPQNKVKDYRTASEYEKPAKPEGVPAGQTKRAQNATDDEEIPF